MKSYPAFPTSPWFRLIAFAFGGALASTHGAEVESSVAPAPSVTPAVENSVVKVFSTARNPDAFKPWQKQSPRESSGTGVVIEGNRILTNAHVVLYASQVQVQANQSGDKISATVEAIAPGIDLAVLKLEDEIFFDNHPPLERASTLPQIKDNVMAYGFPTGGTSLSITKGIVSRIEFANYGYPVSGLRIQIDAAINPGNSGGPAMAGDKMIGVAFQRLGGGDNIGYIIPSEEIELFLKDVADGIYDGKPTIFDELQNFTNPALRSYLKLTKSVEGILVTATDRDDSSYPLKPWDVITKIGDTKIDDEGMIRVGDHLRLHFKYKIQHVAADGLVPLTVVREGQELALQVPVYAKRPMLIADLQGAYPSYFVFGPLCFTAATSQFVGPLSSGSAAGVLSASGNPFMKRRGEKPAFEGEQLVVVSSPFFPHKLSKGYPNSMAQVIATLNGTPVKNLRHFVELLRDLKDEFVVIDFASRGADTLVLPREETAAATEEILTDNGVRAQGSADTLAVWNAKST